MDMAEDQVLSELDRLTKATIDATSAQFGEERAVAQAEVLAKEHQEDLNAIVREFQAKRAALEAQLREDEIARIRMGLNSN